MVDLARYDDWIAWLTAMAESDDSVRSAWIGGSAATGGWDQWSDLDVVVLCSPGCSIATYHRWLEAARATFDIRDLWELPAESWPDGRQCFINLQDRPGLLAEPTRLIDLYIGDVSDQHTHVDVRRHGTPLVLHDPDGLLVLEHEDVSAALEAAVAQVAQRRVTGEWLVNRAIARGHVAEALELYLRFPLAGVIRLVRAEHCPWRHDFGPRYLRRDLPPEVADRVEALVPGAGGADLRELSERCFAWLEELLERLAR